MKTICVLALCLCCHGLFAQVSDEKIDSLIVILQSEEVFLTSLETMIEQQKNSPMAAQIPEGFFPAFLAKAKKEAYQAMLPQFRQLYRETYTAEEIDFLLALYASPLGAQIAKKQGQLSAAASLIGQKWGEQAGMEVAQEIMSRGGN